MWIWIILLILAIGAVAVASCRVGTKSARRPADQMSDAWRKGIQ